MSKLFLSEMNKFFSLKKMEWHKFKVAISLKAVVLNSKGEVLLLQRPEDDYSRPNGWDIVGGGLDEGESPYDGIKREIKEETGLEVLEVFPIDLWNGKEKDGCDFLMIGFEAKISNGEVSLSEEHQAFKWLSKDEALKSELPETYKDFIRKLRS